MTTKQQQSRAGKPVLRVVVLYGEFESAVAVKGLLARAVEKAGWQGKTESIFWRFDVMVQPPIAREALYRAVDADMVVLAARETVHPPDWLIEWLELWAGVRRVQDAILVAWCRGRHAGRLSKGAQELRELAKQHGLGWLCAEEVAGKQP